MAPFYRHHSKLADDHGKGAASSFQKKSSFNPVLMKVYQQDHFVMPEDHVETGNTLERKKTMSGNANLSNASNAYLAHNGSHLSSTLANAKLEEGQEEKKVMLGEGNAPLSKMKKFVSNGFGKGSKDPKMNCGREMDYLEQCMDKIGGYTKKKVTNHTCQQFEELLMKCQAKHDKLAFEQSFRRQGSSPFQRKTSSGSNKSNASTATSGST